MNFVQPIRDKNKINKKTHRNYKITYEGTKHFKVIKLKALSWLIVIWLSFIRKSIHDLKLICLQMATNLNKS